MIDIGEIKTIDEVTENAEIVLSNIKYEALNQEEYKFLIEQYDFLRQRATELGDIRPWGTLPNDLLEARKILNNNY